MDSAVARKETGGNEVTQYDPEDVATATRLALSVRNFPARALDEDMNADQIKFVLPLSDLSAVRQQAGKLETYEFTSSLQFALDVSVSSYAEILDGARERTHYEGSEDSAHPPKR
jgi:hypothetical protein